MAQNGDGKYKNSNDYELRVGDKGHLRYHRTTPKPTNETRQRLANQIRLEAARNHDQPAHITGATLEACKTNLPRLRKITKAQNIKTFGYEEGTKWSALGVSHQTCIQLKKHGITPEFASTRISLATTTQQFPDTPPEFAHFVSHVNDSTLAELAQDGTLTPNEISDLFWNHKLYNEPPEITAPGRLHYGMEHPEHS